MNATGKWWTKEDYKILLAERLNEEKTLLPMELPKCKVHGVYMMYQTPYTPERKFTGPMYKCPQCGNSISFPSIELLRFLAGENE